MRMSNRSFQGAACVMLASFLAVLPCGAGEEKSELTVLDTSSFWRCWFTMRDPVVGTRGKAEPAPPGKNGHRFNSELPPADWMTVDFDATDWARRPGPFFGGSGAGEPMTLGLLCLRGTFGVDEPAGAGALVFSAAYRGGIVVYVNGKELARGHMPEGEIDGETLADDYPWDAYAKPDGKPAGPKDKDQCELRIRRLEGVSIPRDLLRKGVNVLGIELHRAALHPDSRAGGQWSKAKWSTAGLSGARLACGGSGIAPNLERPKGLQVWNADPLAPVFDADYGDPFEPLRPIRIVGARNGTFSGMIVLGCDQPIKGLSAAMGDLALEGGTGAIPASSIALGYPANEGRAGGVADRYPGMRDVTMFDAIPETPPAETPVWTKQSGKGYSGPPPVFGAVQPVWLTVNVPSDALPGTYKGRLTVKTHDSRPVEAPVELKVCAWKIPDRKTFIMHTDFVQSPESVALGYDVPYWSDRHFELMGKSFALLGRAANKTVYIHLICRTNHGNSQTMVRWIKQADGSFKQDYSVMDRYLDLCIEHQGKPQFVIFYVSDAYTGQGYFGKDSSKSKWKEPLVSELNPGTGEVTELAGPMYSDVEAAVAFWRPVAEGVRERLKARGLQDRWHIGIASDRKPTKETVAVWKEIAPEAKWVQQGHALDSAYQGVRVGYNTTVWKAAWADDPDVKRTYGWLRGDRVAHFHRDIWRLDANSQMLEVRLTGEKNIAGNQCGFGRINADFWPVLKDKDGAVTVSISSRYPESNWSQCNIRMTPLLWPGPAGAISTARFEMSVEGVQECEARIFIEKALLEDKEGKLAIGGEPPDQTRARLQALLDGRTRALICAGGELGSQWYASSGWRRRSETLFSAAAEVARALGGEGGGN